MRVGALVAACYLAAALVGHARTQISPPLVRVSDGVELSVRRSEPGWSRKTLPPPVSGRDFIIDFYRLGDRYVKVVLSAGLSPEEAEFGLDNFTNDIRGQLNAKLEGLGDEGYLWGNAPDHKNVTFRKGNVVVYMTATLASDVRRFAYLVAAALPGGDRVGLRECSPAARLKAPSPLLKRWTELSPQGGKFRVLFPCDAEARATPEGGSFIRHARTKRGLVTYSVGYSLVSADEARRAKQVYAAEAWGPPHRNLRGVNLVSRRRIVIGGFPATDYIEAYTEDSAGRGFQRTLLVASNTHSYTLMAFSTTEEMLRSAEVEEFFSSFNLIG